MTSPDDPLEVGLRELPAEADVRPGWDPLPAARRYAARRRLARRAGVLAVSVLVVAGTGVGVALDRGGSGGPARLSPGEAPAVTGAAAATPTGRGLRAFPPEGLPLATVEPDPAGAGEPGLTPWAHYPVDATPRPVVFTGDTVLVQGFTSGRAQAAFTYRSVTVPELSTDTGTEDGYATVSSQTAMQRLLAQGTTGTYPSSDRLEIDRPTLGEAAFDTDRGKQQLPAWIFPVPQAIGGSIAVSALPDLGYGPGRTTGSKDIFGPAQLSGDGRQLILRVVGVEHPSDCESALPTVFVAESSTAVALSLGYPPGPKAGARPTACPANLVLSRIVVALPGPLGNRVLVSGGDGTPIEVTP